MVLPYFAVVVQGGTRSSRKSVSRVGLRFADGELRASTHRLGDRPGAAARRRPCRRTSASQITRERKPGDPDAAIDPMADPGVREAVRRASFEVLVGFQLTQDQLAYNATR